MNRRLYTRELINKAVTRMQKRIADPQGLPIVMRTHHDAGDNSSLIVGRITDAHTDEQGAAKYSADLYDTEPGRDIATLTTAKNPALRSTSIHGYWLGPVRRVEHQGKSVETADDLDVDAIDFTASPGVPQAVLDITPSQPSESTVTRTPITETYEATIRIPDDDMMEKGAPALKSGKPAAPQTKAKTYADPGYQDDRAPRYALDTKAQVKAAWSYINMPKNAKLYTAAQLAKVKGRIKAAAKKFGIDISSDESCLIERGESILEFYGDDMPSGRFCVSISNGPIDIVISSGCVDPDDLELVGQAAMNGAMLALRALDPDDDGDIDVPGQESTTGVFTSVDLAREVQRQLRLQSQSLDQEPTTTESTTTEQEPTVSEAKTDEATTTGAPAAPATDTVEQQNKPTTLNAADLRAIGETMGAAFAAALKEHAPTAPITPVAAAPTQATETTPAPVATESTPKVDEATVLKETLTTAVSEAVGGLREELVKSVTTETSKVRDELREELQRIGIRPTRLGFRVHENTQDDPTPEQLYDNRAQVLLGDFARTPVPHTGTGTAPAPTTTASTAQG